MEPSTTQRRHIVCGSRRTGGDDGANAAASAGAGETVMERLCHTAGTHTMLAAATAFAPPRDGRSGRGARQAARRRRLRLRPPVSNDVRFEEHSRPRPEACW